MKIFTIYDSKSEAYLPPIYFKTPAEAIRAFSTAVQDPQTQFNKYPSDFTLFELGEFQETTALISTHQIPRILSNASEHLSLATNSQISQHLKPLITQLDSQN